MVAPRPPLPTGGGSDLRNLQHLAVLHRAGWEVHLLVVDPTSWSPGAGNEAWAHCHVCSDPTVATVQGDTDRERFTWITSGAHPFAGAATERTRADLRRTLASVDPQLVVVSGHEVSALLPDARHASAAVVLDLHDVLERQLASLGRLMARHPALGLLYRRAAAAAGPSERSLLPLADQVWACSDVDSEHLRGHGAEVPVATVPNTVDVASYPAPALDGSPRLVLTASFGYPPNLHAALELVDALDALSDVSLDLVGRDAPAELMTRAAGHPRVRVVGAVDDVRPYLQRAWVAPMPLRAGSGTRLKVGEAAAARVPIVATAKAVEGIPMEPDHHYLRAETPEETVHAIRTLVDDPVRRRALADAAHAFAVEHLSWDAAGRATRSALEALGTVA